MDRRTFVMGAAAIGAAALTGGMLGGCAGGEGAEPAVGSAPVEPSPMLEPAPASSSEPLPYDSVFPPHEPCGRGVGARPGRVAWVRDAAAVTWDGSGYWWQREHFDEDAVRRMVDDGSAMSYTTPVLLRALLLSLVEDAGVAAGDIAVYDACRIFPAHMMELCSEGALAGVRFRYYDEGGPNDAAGDESAPVVWSADVAGAANVVPACVSEADYLINLASLKGHSYGLTLCGKNHFGSLVNSSRLRPPEAAGIHRYVSGQAMGMYTVLVDLFANRLLGGKTMLWMLDGLVPATSEGASVTREAAQWEGAPFDGGFAASIFLSQDPVAIDSVGADFLINQPAVVSRNAALEGNLGVQNYLHEAALASAPPSGAAYRDGAGNPVESLGVHEHWNNSVERLYSRDRGESEGIELVRILR